MTKVYCGECGKFMGEVRLERGYVMYLTCGDCIANARQEPVSVMDIVFGDMSARAPEKTTDDGGIKEEDPLWARVAAWEKEHPGKSYWDGAMAALG